MFGPCAPCEINNLTRCPNEISDRLGTFINKNMPFFPLINLPDGICRNLSRVTWIIPITKEYICFVSILMIHFTVPSKDNTCLVSIVTGHKKVLSLDNPDHMSFLSTPIGQRFVSLFHQLACPLYLKQSSNKTPFLLVLFRIGPVEAPNPQYVLSLVQPVPDWPTTLLS